MSDKFSIEIISPEKTILKSETREVTIPSFEGQMGILKDHIPSIISIKDQEEKKYYVEEGIVEFSNNKLLILTSTANNLKNFEKEIIDRLINDAEKKLIDNNTTDKEKYIVSYKIDTLREINR